MSFSSKSKNELVRIKTEGRCCNRAELSGIIRVSGALEFGGRNMMNLRIVTENPAVARLTFILLKKRYGLQTELIMKETKVLNKHHSYEIFIDQANEVLLDLGILAKDGEAITLNDDLPEEVIKKNCCKKAYLRGIYLGGGSLSAPEKSYHLELITHNEYFANQLVDFINDTYDLASKMTARKKNYIVYIKESEKIVDFLNVIGAHQTLLEYENIRIIKQMRNNVNRVVNCETANITKTADAAFEHIHAIETIIQGVGLDYLDDRLREIAECRLENPEATLKELGEMLIPPIGKSGVNHRLKKIMEIAEQINKRMA
ncbi:MAG: DNA-binding protein WhiA [Firmicutes bacterium]|nr:DNA-binding protein WhiA [Bacillota bacterium]